MGALSLSVIFMLVVSKVVISLKCYQTNNEIGETSIVDDDGFKFCIIFPSILDSTHFTKSISDGLKIDELDEPVGYFFEKNDGVYQLLSTCLFEKYDWSQAWNIKFKISKKVEYTLRCICNTDLCNSPESFSNHINFFNH